MLFRNTSHFLVASFASALFGLLSAVVFTRLLNPGEYGLYVVGVSLGGFVSAVLFTWVKYSAMRFQSEGGDVDVRATALAAYAASACLAPFVVAGAALISGLPMERAAFALLFALGLSLFELGQELLKARLQIRAFVLTSILRSAAAFLLCLGAAELGGGGLGQLAMAALAYFIAAAAATRSIWGGHRAPFEFTKLKLFLRLGGPITVASFVYAFHGSLDRLFIAAFLGDHAAGLYGASADLVRQIILIPASSVASAALPLAVRNFARGDNKETRAHLSASLELLLAILLPAVVGFALISPYLAAILLGAPYRETANAIMPILAFAWLFQSISQSYVHLSFHLAKRPELAILHGLVTLAVNAAALWPLTWRFGLPGAAAAVVLAEAAGMAFGFGLTRFGHALAIPWRALARIAAASGAMILAILVVEMRLSEPGVVAFALIVAAGVTVYALAAVALDVADARALLRGALERSRAGRQLLPRNPVAST